MRFEPLEGSDVDAIREWRNAQPAGLRTAVPLTNEQQWAWFQTVIRERDPHNTYLAARDGGFLRACVGLTNIDWANGHAELSCICAPDAVEETWQRALGGILSVGFYQFRLNMLYAEVYECSENRERWLAAGHCGRVSLPARKWWDGRWWASDYLWWLA